MRYLVFLALLWLPLLSQAEDLFPISRVYTPGEEFGYTLKTTSYENGQFDEELVAESQHQVMTTLVPEEEIRWRSLTRRTADGTQDISADAQAVAPYRISLHPAGSLALPPLTAPQMTSMITDLNTFYVAVSPKIGIQRLSQPGDRFENPLPLKGIWSNGDTVLLGEDCIQATLTWVSLTEERAIVRTEFRAPDTSCLSAQPAWMSTPVTASVPNNIQQIRKTGGTFMVMWGHEEFTVTSELDRASGKIRRAWMDNTLITKMRVGCDASLERCQAELPWVIHRELTLDAK